MVWWLFPAVLIAARYVAKTMERNQTWSAPSEPSPHTVARSPRAKPAKPRHSPLATVGTFRGPMLVFVGRTGAGKSSLINCVVGANLAEVGHVASTTRAIHGFPLVTAMGEVTLVDTPGIGEAKTSDVYWNSGLQWIEKNRKSIAAFVLVIAADGKAHQEDIDFIRAAWEHCRCPLVVALNQVDKMKPVRSKLLTTSWETERRASGPKARHIAEKLELIHAQTLGLEGTKHFIPVAAEDVPGFNVIEFWTLALRVALAHSRTGIG